MIATLLAALLGAGAPAAPARPDPPAQDTPADPWQAAAALEDPARRTEALLGLLEDPAVPVAGAALQIAYEAGLEAAAAFELERALRLQTALHERAGEPWSAANVALTLRRLDRYDEADAVLTRALGRAERDSAEMGFLLNQRALSRLGSGDRRRALDDLGRGLLLGDPDAAVVLARDALLRRDLDAARAGFRALLVEGEPGAWALRGWGLTLIENPESPATRSHGGPSAAPANER